MTGLYVRNAVKCFAKAMEHELRNNDHKRGWLNESPEDLLVHLKEEVAELERALKFPDVEDPRGEAADVANLAMMIWDVIGGPQ